MGKLINHDKAKAYLDRIPDPIVQALIEYAYSQIFVGEPVELDGDFDLLFFFGCWNASCTIVSGWLRLSQAK